MFPKIYNFLTPKSIFFIVLLSCFVLTSFDLSKVKEHELAERRISDCNTTLIVENKGECPLYLYEWLANGDQFETIIQAGDSYSVATQKNTMWRVTNGDFNNLVYDESITVTDCPEQTWVTFPVYCSPEMTSWNFDCDSGRKVEIIGTGIKNDIPHTLYFANSSNIYKTVVEIIYKGGNPGEKITLHDHDGNPFTAYRELVPGGSSNVWVYRAFLPGVTSITISEQSEDHRAQSMVAYLFRENVLATQQTGHFTYLSGYNNIETLTFDIETLSESRDIQLSVPISELTDDGRYLSLEASAGGVSTQEIVYGPNSVLGCCLDIIELTIENVPAGTSQVTLEIDTRHNQNGQSVNGQSYVLAGAVEVDAACSDLGGCEKVLVTYTGSCDDPSDCLLASGISPSLTNVSGVCPQNGVANASCLNDVICISTTYNYWGFDFTAQSDFEFKRIDADLWYPTDGSNAGGMGNLSSCPTSFDAVAKFYVNGDLHSQVDVNVEENQIITKNIAPSAPIYLATGMTLSVTIEGLPTSEDCDLLELAGLRVIGCEDVISCGDVLVKYTGSCDDPSDCLLASEEVPSLGTVTGVCPANGVSNASCMNDIICISTTYNSWEFSITADNTVQVSRIDADLWYPTDGSNAGGMGNLSSCPTSFDAIAKFYVNGVLHSTSNINIEENQIITKYIAPSSSIILLSGSTLSVTIEGVPTSTDCDLLELAGLRVIGCEDPEECNDEELNAPVDVLLGCNDSIDPSEIGYPTICGVDILDATYTDEINIDDCLEITRTWEYQMNVETFDCPPTELVYYSMDGCDPSGPPGFEDCDTNGPTVINNGGCANISATAPCNDAQIDFSCNAGFDGNGAVCFPADGDDYYDLGDEDIVTFDITITPEAGERGVLSGLSFYTATGLTTNSGDEMEEADYLGIRILKNGNLIFFQDQIPLSETWSFEEIELGTAVFQVEESTTFVIEMMGYGGNDGGNSASWDFDELKIYGGCCQPVNNVITLTDTQTINIEDNTAPTVSNVPNDITVNCEDTPAIVAPDFSDDCDAELEVVFEEEMQFGLCEDNYSILRKWTATDDCGNATTANQLVVFTDTTLPVFSSLPQNMTVECSAIPAPENLTATDNCDDDVTVSFNENIINGNCTDNYQLERIWIATDNCGNTRSHTQIITVTDMTPPVFAPLADVTLECSDNLSAPNPVVTDNCDNDVTVVLNDEYTTAGFCTDEYTITRVWTATDNCGNQSTLTQVTTVVDTQSPSISAPADQVVSCDAVPAAGTPVVFDNCDDDLLISFAEVRTDGDCPNNYILTRTWTAMDNCGNISSDEQILTVVDSEGPEILDVPASVTVECDLFPVAPTLSIQDNCDANATIELQEEMQAGLCEDNYSVIRTWTATDACGNITTAIQVVTVTDTQAPVLSNIPADQTVECDAIPQPASPTATDNCDTDVTIEFVENSTQTFNGSCTDNSYTLTRIWKATDNCGNVDIQEQVITVEDTTNPILGNLPANQMVECDEIPVPAILTATDNCDTNVEISFSESSNKTNKGDCSDDTYEITRTWVATDNCGNTDTYTQTIYVEDYTAPVLANIPADITINSLPVPSPASPTATDNCDGDVLIEFEEISGEGCAYEIIRTWTAIDNCGNQDVKTQTITVQVDPQAGTLNIDDPLVCIAPVGSGIISATPNGDANVPVGFDIIYVLTKGNNLVIEQVNTTPTFTVLTEDNYTIHTLIYVSNPNDPNYLDLSIVDFGVTEAGIVNGLLQQGGGSLCGSLDLAGAQVIADKCDAKIGNRVFEDLNANGIQDVGEPGIAGVTVNIQGTTSDGEVVFASQITDANGFYTFDELAPGDYNLTFIKPVSFETTYADQSLDDNIDSDPNQITGITISENLESGEDNQSYDAGFFQTGTIGDLVFEDKNANGIFDFGEEGIEGVNVTLTGTTGNGTAVTMTTTTDGNGNYSFVELIPGSYKLTFETPAGYVVTYQDEGGNDNADSDVDPSNEMTIFEDVESGETNLTYDAGYYRPATIGDFVFEDINGNGIQEAGENGIADVEVTLTGTTGNGTLVNLTTTTDATGLYAFENLIPGEYKLTFATPLDYETTYLNEGGDDTLDSDVDPSNGMTINEILESGEDNNTYDAGFFKTGKIGDMVFEDKNANGTMDAGEEGIANVEVILIGTTGNGTSVNLSTTTDGDGKYIFEDLFPGEYKLTFVTPTGYEVTYQDEGGNDNSDSDIDPATGMTAFVTIKSGEENTTLDAGYYRPARIGDLAFVDNNGNGIQDVGEVGLPFVTVLLEGTTGNGTVASLTVLTDANGNYSFDNLVPGTYQLTFTADPLYQITNKDLGGDDTLDSDVDPLTGMTDEEVLESGENNLTYDAGYFIFGKIGDFVWLDCNKDGMQSPGEEGIAGVTVNLFGTNGFGFPVQATTVTDADGKYEFEGLVPGIYSLTIDLPTVPSGYAFTLANQGGSDAFDSDFDGGTTGDIIITSGLIINDVDGGLIDDEAPVFVNIPNDITVECDTIPVPIILTATDNLDDNVVIDFVETSTQSGNTAACENNNYTITRTWTASDNCGNSTTVSQVITVEDTTAPELLNVPQNITVECNAIPSPVQPSATDNCDIDVTITYNEEKIDGNCVDNYILERTWTATDNCGNSISQTQIITVQDTSNPELIAVPADVTVECDLVPAPAQPLAIDNCDDDVEISFSEVRTDGACEDSYILTRTWMATDNCGNTDTKIQVITIQDTNAPNIYDIPANVTVECDAIPVPSDAPFATDNCDDDVAITFAEEIIDGDCNDSYSIERTWTATDNCGNAVSGTQVIFVQDTTDPILSGVPANVIVECDAIPAPANPTATDNCDQDVDISFEEVRTNGVCEDSYILTRTWTATDNCGNSDVATQIITVQDTTNPILIGVPNDITVECDAIPSPANPTATDNCDTNVTIDLQEIKTDGNCVDNYTLTRTWTATDNCGNSIAQTQTITVQDTTDPEIFDIPADITVECNAVPLPSNAPFGTDNCDIDVVISFEEIQIDGVCEDNYTLERTWTATDNCGNSISQTQTVTVQDTSNPELIGVPADVTVECDLVPGPAQPLAIDNCDNNIDITFEEIRADGSCEDNYTLTRTWIATDNCGNTDTKIQVITVQDTNAPNIYDIPVNITVECSGIPAPSMAPFANDNCDDDVEITFSEIRIDGACEDNYTLERTWTATDNCGNTDAGTQIITVQDTTDPILEGIPANITVECNNIPAPAQPTATDNCDTDVTIDFSQNITPGGCPDNYTITRTWTATDNCGNTDVQTQVITVQDTTDPNLIGVPTDITVECNNIPVPAQPTATDNCDTDVEISFEVEIIPGDCPDSYTMIRTWTATDNCGNEITQFQTITVQDTTAPILIGMPADITVECDAVPIPAVLSAQDNCDPNPTISFNEIRIDGACVDSYILERTWTITDACGNEQAEMQIITVQDTTDPILVDIPSDITVECDAIPLPASPSATDNCDMDIEISFLENIIQGACTDNYTISRIWTATDNCGNEVSQTQTITVEDTTDPILFGVPANAVVECDAIPVPAQPTATDNCDDEVEITFTEVQLPGICENTYTLSRIWVAKDNCGNTTSATQIITVQDTTDPTLSGVPANITVECDAIPFPAQPVATDNCDIDVVIDFLEVRTDGACDDFYTLTRTWTATDNCGNSSTQTQIIEVQDTTDPILTGVPADMTVECNNIPLPAQPVATDNCDTDVSIVLSENIIDGGCVDGYTLIRTWTATDNCGNSVAETQTLTVEDTTNPIIMGVPADITVECDAIPAIAQPVATDNCDVAVDLDFSENQTSGNCVDNYIITRTWIATDNCGNTTTDTQVITVQDTSNPFLSGVPTDTTVECDAIPFPAQPTATDNCDPDVTIEFAEMIIDGDCMDNYSIERTWTATDNCGNVDIQTQIITVQDTTDPFLIGVPGNVSVECDAIPTPLIIGVDITATDNCDIDVDIVLLEEIFSGSCADNYTIVRTYTATDNCGNEVSQTQIITVEDTTPPTITGVPADLVADCNDVPAAPAPGTIIISDNCDIDVATTFSEIIQPGGCADSYIIQRIWTATDNCGNMATETQTITVADVTPPVLIGVPTDAQVDCNSVPNPPAPGTVTATDNCDINVTIQYFEELIDGACDDSYVIQRTWTAIDNCGNETQATQVITVGDATAPTLIGVPNDLEVECDAIPNPAQPTATDDCDIDVEITFTETNTAGACENSYIITRTWIATDNCGNETIGIQNIIVQDTQAPVLAGIPLDITADCNNIPGPPANVVAIDNCDTEVEIDFLEISVPGACASSTIITRTWTATDNCGNITSASQVITVGDGSAPILANIPSDVTVECNSIPTIPTDIVATDNCDTDPEILFTETTTPGDCLENYIITRTWTAIDDCGNEASQSQIITINDTQAPVLAGIPADVTIDCDNVPAPAMPVATDNCDIDVEIDFEETSVASGCGYIITRTWTATDNCGNITTGSQVLTVNADLPVLSNLPTDLTVECDNIPVPAIVTATSDCLPNIPVDLIENIIDGACENGYVIERTWTTNSGCGTPVSHTQTITVEDTTHPILGNIPSDVTADCNLLPTVPTDIVATDNCDTDPEISFLEILTPGACDNSYILTRTWTATDNCGNESSQSQIITVEDTQAPILAGVPADIMVGCDQVPAPATPVATDNCDIDVIIDFDEVTVADGCGFIITRTWTATDNCGNTVSASQVITVGGDAPVFSTLPADVTVECTAIPSVPTVTASSNCLQNVEVIFSENIIPGACENSYTIERTWSIDASSGCGNAITHTQTIIVEDTQTPILAGIPGDINVGCGNIPSPAIPVATDNCDIDVEILYNEIQNPLACGYELIRTWTAIDNCGNETSASQTIIVEDTENPVLIGVPSDITAECNNIPTVDANVTVTDNCSVNIVIDFAETTIPGACINSYVLVRTWTATDDCGNTVSASQNISIEDITPPTLIDVPANITVECAAIPGVPFVGATDNCDFNVEVILTEVETPLACGYLLTRTWTATDDCGNESTATQEVTVADATPPSLWEVPVDVTVDCADIPAIDQNVSVLDNCDPNATLDFSESYLAGSCPENYIIVRTWTATDNCGNSVSESQNITVEDTQAPVMAGIPLDLTVDCNNVPTPAQPVAIDNCDVDVDIDFIEISVANGCGYVLTRTWIATDNCGNITEASQIITVESDTPVLSLTPADITVECNDIPQVAMVTAQSNCAGTLAVDFEENIIAGSCENSFTIERTWSIASGCGNGVAHTQVITVEDNQAPILAGIPSNLEVNCGMIPDPAQPVATDNCDTDVEILFAETSVQDNCQTIVTRTWTAIDNCGNESSASQIITVNAEPVTFSALPVDITVECSSIPVAADISAFDGCSGAPVLIDFEENIIGEICENSYTLERIWSATSSCGDIFSHTQLVQVEDTTDPILIGVPTDVNTSCDLIPTLPVVTATDNCDADVDILFNEIETPTACGYILVRTWTATDNCGNTSTISQNITVSDDTPPVVAGIPADITVECNNIPTVSNSPVAIDNCDADVDISFNEIIIPGACIDAYTIERIWTATDDCGNMTEGIQVITVQDVSAPTLIGIPNNLTVDLTLGQTIPAPANIIATDNCDIDVEITFEENQSGNGCSYTIERTWTATDNCGNETSATQTIQVIGGLNVTETHTDASCGEDNGSIDLTVSGGVAPITFIWSNGAGNVEDLNNLSEGIYEVTVTDAAGCSAELSIEITNTGALQANISANMVSCFEGNDGSINITIINGLAPFTYDWTGGIGNTPNPTGLTAGSYNVTITDANGCTTESGANVNQPQALSLTFDIDNADCTGGLGTATANVTGGMMPYQYAWSNGATSSTIADLNPGTYTVLVTDNNGCTIEDEVVISEGPNFVISIDKTDVTCYEGNDGTATVSVTGGTPAYSYLWSNGETNANIINLEAGVYTVTVTDGTGCTGSQTVTIISPPELQLTTVSTNETSVGNDGTATVTATGGTLPYQYIWSNGQMTATATGLSAGTYSVTVIDDNGCFDVDEVEVNLTLPSGDVDLGDYVWFDTNRDGIQDPDEVGLNNVTVRLMTAGQDGTFGTLDDEIIATEITSNNPSLTGAGYYLFENVSPGTYQIEFVQSSLPSDYIFTLANEGMDDNLDSDADPITGRTPTFTVIAGQMDNLSLDAGIHPECNNVTTGGAIESAQTICAGDTPDLIVNSIYPTGGGGDFEYIWLSNTTGSPFSNTDPTWTIIQGATDEFYQPGPIFQNTYFIRCVRRVGCMDYVGESNIVPILVTPIPNIQIEQAPTILCLSEEASFQAGFAGATATYLWNFGEGASPQTSTQRNVYNLTYSSTGLKVVTLTVENNGCAVSITYEFEVVNCLNDFDFIEFSSMPIPSDSEVLLEWTTRYEVNNSRFFLEHSKNGDDFQSFEMVNANGSTQEINSYQAMHTDPYYGVNYYRIKYVDANNNITYSKVTVAVFDNGTRDIHVFPNPIDDFAYVEFLTELTEDAFIEVVDMAGRVLSTQVVADGYRTYRVSLEDYPAGTYLIWVRYNDYRKDVQRVVKITE